MRTERLRDVEVDQIVARIRESVRSDHVDSQADGLPAGLPRLGTDHEIATDVDTLHASHDVSRGRPPSRRPLLGPAIGLGWKILNRFLAPVLAQQARYNAACCRLTTQMVARLDALASRAHRETGAAARALTSFEERIGRLGDRVAAQQEDMAAVRDQVSALRQSAATLARELSAQSEHVANLDKDEQTARDVRLRTLGDEVAAMRREVSGYHEGMRALDARLALQREQTTALSQTVADHARDIGGRGARLDLQQEHLELQQSQLRRQADQLQRQADQLQGQADQLQRQEHDLQRQAEQLQSQREQLQGQRDQLQGQRADLAAVAQRTDEHRHGVGTLDSRIQRQQEELAAILHGLARQEQQMRAGDGVLRDELARLDQGQKALVASLRERLARSERRMRHLANGGPGGELPHRDDTNTHGPPQVESPQVESPQVESPQVESKDLEGLDYAGFEERFRGSEEEIKARQRAYVDLFRERADVLDFGCGRGEFLELLREARIPCRGVDADLDMILLCREKGLEVTQADGFAYLDTLPDDSLGGVFAAQVIEHLEPRHVLRLIALIHRKLRPGGVAVLETVNPGCLATFSSFYLDLTHVRPIPPGTLEFLLESADFADVRIAYASPVDEALRIPRLDPARFAEAERFNGSIDRLNDMLFGHRDFAAIAVKGQPVAAE